VSGIGVNRARPVVAGVKSADEVKRFLAPNFTDNHPVGILPQAGFDKMTQGNFRVLIVIVFPLDISDINE
jgi:hypothetical protein